MSELTVLLGSNYNIKIHHVKPLLFFSFENFFMYEYVIIIIIREFLHV